jgi:Calcium-binding EGF domain
MLRLLSVHVPNAVRTVSGVAGQGAMSLVLCAEQLLVVSTDAGVRVVPRRGQSHPRDVRVRRLDAAASRWDTRLASKLNHSFAIAGSCAANSSWAFGECPDVDECALGLHECHPAATCRNTPGAYECACPQGFVGDGRRECRRTCPLECVHGRCGGAPDYECACSLGWTGAACNQSCGCHGHASCGRGPGHCDECAHFTAGPM